MSKNKKSVMSQAEFARHRGVSRATVTEYKTRGLLVMTAAGEVEVEASERLLTDNLDPTRGGDRTKTKKQPAANQNSEFMRAKTREMEAKAVKQEMETRKLAGELVEREVVHRIGFTLARNAQESMMAIADRLSPLLAAELDAAKVHEMLSKELRGVCQELAKAAREQIE